MSGFALSILVKNAQMAQFCAGALLSTDYTHIGIETPVSQLTEQATTWKAITASNAQAQLTSAISICQANGFTRVDLNEEKVSGVSVTAAQFLTDLASAYLTCHGDGLTIRATPTGINFAAIVSGSQLATLVANCDEACYQAESQQESGTGWQTTVAANVALWQAATTKPITVQLSVNPPANRTATAAQVISDITALTGACSPNVIQLFYTTTDAGRTLVAQQVIQNYRGGQVIAVGVGARGPAAYRAAATHRTAATHRASASHRTVAS